MRCGGDDCIVQKFLNRGQRFHMFRGVFGQESRPHGSNSNSPLPIVRLIVPECEPIKNWRSGNPATSAHPLAHTPVTVVFLMG